MEFVSVDIETSGFSPKYESIISIGAVHIVDGKVAGEFYELIHTSRKLSDDIIGITGITNRDLEEARGIQEVLHDFFAFLGEKPFVAHNADFDYRFIKEKGMKKLNYIMMNKKVCTMREGKKFVKGLDGYRLNNLADHYGIPNIKHHNALNDARVCADILLCIIGRPPVATRPNSTMNKQYMEYFGKKRN